MKPLLWTMVPLIALAGCGRAGGGNETAANAMLANNATETMNQEAAAEPAALAPTQAAAYLAQAGAGDMFEIESSKVALDKSKDAKVRDFAQMMIEAHQASTAKVKAAAAEAKLTVAPPALTPQQQAMLDEIKSAPAAMIDAVYLRNQRTAHDAALALHQGYAASGDTPALKKAASEIAPVVQEHIAHLAELPKQ